MYESIYMDVCYGARQTHVQIFEQNVYLQRQLGGKIRACRVNHSAACIAILTANESL